MDPIPLVTSFRFRFGLLLRLAGDQAISRMVPIHIPTDSRQDRHIPMVPALYHQDRGLRIPTVEDPLLAVVRHPVLRAVRIRMAPAQRADHRAIPTAPDPHRVHRAATLTVQAQPAVRGAPVLPRDLQADLLHREARRRIPAMTLTAPPTLWWLPKEPRALQVLASCSMVSW